MKKDYCVFNLSFVLRAIGLGVFTTLFNLYILSENRFSESFLELFLAVGNLSMALSSYFVGILIDNCSKKKLMVIFTILCGICMLFETIETNETAMYLISIVYGVGATGLFTLTPPVLKTYESENKRNLIITNRAINIISITLGAIIAGVLTSKTVGVPANIALLAVPALYLLSALVYLFHSESKLEIKKDSLGIRKNLAKASNSIPIKLLLITIIIFMLLGFAPMLVNYINVYFLNRFSLNISRIAYIYAIINLLSGVFIIFLSKINFENINSMIILFISIVFINILLIFCYNLVIQVIGVFLYICLFEILTSCIYEFVLSKGRSEIHGKLSGVIQASCNLSETLGIYACGWMLGKKLYVVVFGLSIISTVISAVMIVLLMQKGIRTTCAEK